MGDMMEKNIKTYYRFLLLSLILVILDQFSKIYIKGFNFFGLNHQGMSLGESHSFIGDLISITFVENPGMAFGIEFGIFKILLTLFSLFASVLLIIYLKRIYQNSNYINLGIIFILAGALGNWVDRMFYGVFYNESPLFYGKVVDFIQVDIPDIDFMGLYYTHWPVFNFADSYVWIGVCLLILFHKQLPDIKDVFLKKKD